MFLDEPPPAPDSVAQPQLRAPSLVPSQVRDLALEAGFDEAGLVPLPYPQQSRDAGRFEQFIASGHAASMNWLARRSSSGSLLRARTATPFPWARSAIVCFAVYDSAAPRSTEPAPPGSAWIARYAWSSRPDPSDHAGRRIIPSDYHKVLLKRLRSLDERLHQLHGPFESRAYVDTGPLNERALAAAAGLGWTGKNTCLIHPRLGSFGFVAVLLAALPVVAESAAVLPVPDRCGTCRRCLDACPTQALIEPYRMDASRCIAYLTIEHKGALPEPLLPGIGRQVFGCDICQDVCPWNNKAAVIRAAHREAANTGPANTGSGPVSASAGLEPRAELVNPALDWLASLDESAFERAFNGSPVRRTGFAGFRRNLAVAMGNSGLSRYQPTLAQWASSADAGIRAAAQWALSKLSR